MEKIAIKLNIANRIYPMKIDRSSEEYIRKAIKNVDERLKFYESNYAIKDKQDLLAMCLIEYASKLETLEKKDIIDSNQKESLMKIEDMLDAIL
tara:strand:- start:1937 stop:2218 length:282 start_codon:yes stop_codon:yes gene_type:complete